jgi:solute carrier family 13 (sodium-dependent dicarboxylate transporter), member 2/3/5
MDRKRTWFLALGPVIGALAGAGVLLAGLPAKAAWCAAVTALCATWWVTEPIPIPATSLIPFAAFPLAGVLSHTGVASAYGHSLILLLLGGFMLSMGMEKSGAHRRLALGMVKLVGGVGGSRLVLGFMIAAAVLSMWISNTATTLMLLPVALAVIEQSKDDKLTTPLLLGTAYAASVGGIGTPVGTPPNVILMGVYQEHTGQEISFLKWMVIGVPIVIVMLPAMWLWLCRSLGPAKGRLELPSPGPWRPAEKRVLTVFALTALLWITRSEPFGGWSKLIGADGTGDATVALAAVVAMFLIPDGEGDRLLDWETAARIPWGLLLLFGGGIAIARAFGESGLSQALGAALSSLASWPLVAMLVVITLSVTFLTEITSNTATTSLLMPILAAAATAAAIDPRLLMIPAAISASCAFMLPVATAPNAIVFGTGKFTTSRMAREGFALNLLGAAVITIVCVLLLPK